MFKRAATLLLAAGLVAASCSSSDGAATVTEVTTSDAGASSAPTTAADTTTTTEATTTTPAASTTVPNDARASTEPAQEPVPEPFADGNYAVASANPLATDAGMHVLAEGGSAVDAAVAIQAVLGLVEPQSSGIGGGAFLLHYDAGSGEILAYDGREEAPGAATPEMFLADDGTPLGFIEATGSGHAVGVPGVVAMLAAAHDAHGWLDWGGLFDGAISLSRDGIEVSPRMGDALGLADAFGVSDGFRALYGNGEGGLLATGDLFVNEHYADTLAAVALDWTSFYVGKPAFDMVAAAEAEPLPGTLTLDDLAGYAPQVAAPLCHPFDEWTICGSPPPTSGGVGVLSLMGQLDNVDIAEAGPASAGWHFYIEASQRAYADRDRYVADDRFVEVPLDELLDPTYLAERAATIDPAAASVDVAAGDFDDYPRAADSTDEPSGTSHFVVVDAAGNVVTMTTSVESVFGSRRVAAGFVLNNQLTDFARDPATDELVANAVEPGKRPRSSMAPTFVLDADGQIRIALGSPGGSSIIGYVSKTLVGMLAWGLSATDAIALPNIVARSGGVSVESNAGDDLVAELTALGHTVSANASEISGLHLIEIAPDGTLTGAADPRREGTFATSAE